MRFEGKVAIVTGSSKGIGRATAIKLAREGASVVINEEFSSDAGQAVLAEIQAMGAKAIVFNCDISIKMNVEKLVDKAVDEFGRIDIMVANAGICPFRHYDEIDEQVLEKVISVNQKGSFYCGQIAANKMRELNIPGRLVFTSSVSAVFGGEQQVHYCGTKGAVNQMMKSFAIALGPFGITANAVQPGTVLTDINRKELDEDPELLEAFIKRTPVGRLATPEDVASAICFYASDESSCINGTALTIDGGMSVNFQ